jgi:hypothetical protein
MKNPALFRRSLAAVGLMATAVLMFVSVLFAPPFPGDFESLLTEIDQAGWQGTVSALAFSLAQLPLLAGLLGIGHLLRDRAPVLSNVGTSLGLVGAFGHSVFGGVTMVQLSMAGDAANRGVHADILRSVESGPAVTFMVMGLLGTVLGMLLLSIGLWRARVMPRWVAPALWAFLVVEFAGTAVSDWAAPVSGVLYLVALGALGVTVWRTPLDRWRTERESLEGPRTLEPLPG